MNEHETSADIIADMRTKAECAKPYDDGIVMMLTDYADRFEAALKRELSKNASKNGADFGQLGDAAKLREALNDACYAMFNFLKAQNGGYEEMASALDKAKAALAAPPRNCDKYPHDQALRIWSAEPENPMNGCFDVWLYAPATEKEGGVK